jgi:hypothetical protein
MKLVMPTVLAPQWQTFGHLTARLNDVERPGLASTFEENKND